VGRQIDHGFFCTVFNCPSGDGLFPLAKKAIVRIETCGAETQLREGDY